MSKSIQRCPSIVAQAVGLLCICGCRPAAPPDQALAASAQITSQAPLSLEAAVEKSEMQIVNAPLIVITISPEARVKAASQAGSRALVQREWCEFLISIENAAGITAPLQVASEQELDGEEDSQRDRWLKLELTPAGPLSGQPTEQRSLRLWSRDAGMRTAILQFDAGQGTQDLGFRSDVMLTFNVGENRE